MALQLNDHFSKNKLSEKELIDILICKCRNSSTKNSGDQVEAFQWFPMKHIDVVSSAFGCFQDLERKFFGTNHLGAT